MIISIIATGIRFLFSIKAPISYLSYVITNKRTNKNHKRQKDVKFNSIFSHELRSNNFGQNTFYCCFHRHSALGEFDWLGMRRVTGLSMGSIPALELCGRHPVHTVPCFNTQLERKNDKSSKPIASVVELLKLS